MAEHLKTTKFVLYTSSFLIGLFITSFIVSIPALDEKIVLNLSSIQLYLSSLFFSLIIFLFPSFYLIQKYGTKYALITATSFFIISSLFAVSTPSSFNMLITRILDGFSAAVIIATLYYLYKTS